MELRYYMRIFSKRGWIIILTAVLTAASALVFSRVQTPVYRSTIMLNVWSARLDWGLQQTVKGLMRNYALNIKSRGAATEVVNRLQLDMTPEQLQSKLTVDPIESDFLIRIDADDYDPAIARDIAQTTADVFVETITAYMLKQDVRERVEVTLLDRAEIGGLHKPKWKTNSLAGGILGIIAGALVVFILEWLEADVIRTSADAEHYTGVAILGIIPAANGPARSRHTLRGAG